MNHSWRKIPSRSRPAKPVKWHNNGNKMVVEKIVVGIIVVIIVVIIRPIQTNNKNPIGAQED